MKTKPKNKAPPKGALVPTVLDAYAAARVNIEAVVLLDYIARELPQMFVNFAGKPPPLLIDDGLGSLRAASLDAVTLVMASLAGQSDTLKKKADALLGVRVDADVLARPVEELPVMKVVEAPPVAR